MDQHKTFIKESKGTTSISQEAKLKALRTVFLYEILVKKIMLWRERLYKNFREKLNRINENNNNKFKREIEEIINNLEIEVFRPWREVIMMLNMIFLKAMQIIRF